MYSNKTHYTNMDSTHAHIHTPQHTHTHTTTTHSLINAWRPPKDCVCSVCSVCSWCCGVGGCDLKWHLTGFPGHQAWCMPAQWASSTLSVVSALDEPSWRFHLSPLSKIELTLMKWPHWPPFWLPWDTSTMYPSNGSYKVLWRVCVGVSPVVVMRVPTIGG